MFEDADNIADLFRGGLPYYILLTLPILIICSSNPVLASSEFNVQRMAQYDVHGVSYGCRASALNLEAKSLHTWTTSRHCIITRFQDLTIDQFREIRAKAGGLIVLLPENLATLSLEQQEHIYALEQAIMAQEVAIPVFFSKFNPELNSVIEDISNSDDAKHLDEAAAHKRESALSEIINSISANGYQLVVSGAHHSANKQSKIPIIQGELFPILKVPVNKNAGQASPQETAASNKLPLIILTAHLDTFGLINDHLSNVDVAVLLSLIDTFSKIHNSVGTAPKYRLLFLVSEAGSLLNFQGMKKWLDTNLDENVSIQNAEFVLCLDAIGQSELDGSLFMHVSKPPKEGTHISNFFKQLKQNAQRYANITVEGVHKKINLADVQLAWEHERFSMKRMSAFTLSSLKSHKDPHRTTVFERAPEETLAIAERNAKILAETLASYVYGTDSNSEIFSASTAITGKSIKPWLQVRSSLVNNDLKNAFEKYLKNVKVSYDKPDPREPDFMFYEGYDGVLNVYSVKPAVFDLFLTFVIVAYLGVVYLAILYFAHLYSAICKISNNSDSGVKVKEN